MAPTRSSFTGFCHLESSTWPPQALTKVMVFFFVFCFFGPHCSTTTHLCQHVHTYVHSRTHRTPQTFSSFTAGCLLVRGLALAHSSRLFKVEPCNYKAITPRLMQLLLSFCPGSFSHQASFICGLGPIVSCGRWEA